MRGFSGLFSTQHQKNVEFKRKQREERIQALSEYHKPSTSREESVLSKYVEDIVRQVSSHELKPIDVLRAYGKAALVSQERTNCLTEVMIRDAEKWAQDVNLKGPLAGIPVSLKDPFYVVGYDSTAGYSSLVNKPRKEDGATVRLLREAGAVPYVKTNIPITMMAIEGRNDLFGRTVNPWKSTHAPGGSSQGEGALIGSGGSRIGLGSDIGGSVRIPAAWSGIYSLRFSSHRFPSDGDIHSDTGYEGIPGVVSPMAATWKDLKYFSDAVMGMKPWKYDFKLVAQPWRADAKLPEKLKIGVLRLQDYLPPTPAVERALSTTVSALKKKGYEVVDFDLPDPAKDYDETIWKLHNADEYAGLTSYYISGETGEPYIDSHRNYTWWPTLLRRMFEFILNLLGYKEKAWRLRIMTPLSVSEYYSVVSRRQQLRRRIFDKWNAEKFDFLISPPHPSPALPNNTTPDSVFTILYTSLWNLLDYPAGILPVGRVEKATDTLPVGFSTKKMNHPTQVVFNAYSADEMEGLPLAVQVIAPRYQDEDALAAMKVVEDSLNDAGVYYK